VTVRVGEPVVLHTKKFANYTQINQWSSIMTSQMRQVLEIRLALLVSILGVLDRIQVRIISSQPQNSPLA
jgi:hypothetical protein